VTNHSTQLPQQTQQQRLTGTPGNPDPASPHDGLLIVRLSAMGDIIQAMAAVSALRAAWPECRIGWAIETRWMPLLCAPGFPLHGERGPERPLADEIFPLDLRSWRSHPGSPSMWREMRDGLSTLKRAGYRTAVDLQGAIRSAIVARLSGAAEVWGEASPRETLSSIFHRRRVAVTGRHVIEQNLALLSAVTGTPLHYHEPLLPRDAATVAWVEELLSHLAPEVSPAQAEAQTPGEPGTGKKRIVILSPGAGWGAKCWPVASFVQVARELAEAGMVPVVNYGPGEEGLAHELVEASQGAAMAVPCSVSQLIELTRRAKLFIGGDSGPMHLAAALGVPVVALFGPTNPVRSGPYGTRSVVLRNERSATSYSHTSRPDEALHAIPPAEVMQAVHRLLQPPTTGNGAGGNGLTSPQKIDLQEMD
jgi:heptosyltransferase-1